MYDPILAAVDGSDAARRAAEEAFRLAREFDATVHLLYVLDESASTLLLSTESLSNRFDRLRSDAEEFLADLAADAGDLAVETAVIRGMGVYRGIVGYAEREGVELIAMGSRGRHGPAGVLGNTSERVGANTDIPVLLVSGPEEPPDDEPPDEEAPDDGSPA